MQAIEKLLEDNDYSCVIDYDKQAVYCFDADKWFYTIEEVLEWFDE